MKNKTFRLPAIASILYLTAIRPGMKKKPDEEALGRYYYAHRGLHTPDKMIPENSLPAFAAAADAGYGIELDVHLSRDRIPVVFHDFKLERVCHVPGQIEDYTVSELKQFSLEHTGFTIPTLKEVLTLVNGRVPLLIEYKSEDRDLSICEIVQPMLDHYNGLYCIESFNPLVLYWYRKNCPQIVRGQLSSRFHDEYKLLKRIFLLFPIRHLLFNFLTRPDFIAYNHLYPHALSRRLCYHLYRRPCAAWTVRSEEDLNRLRPEFNLFIFEYFRP